MLCSVARTHYLGQKRRDNDPAPAVTGTGVSLSVRTRSDIAVETFALGRDDAFAAARQFQKTVGYEQSLMDSVQGAMSGLKKILRRALTRATQQKALCDSESLGRRGRLPRLGPLDVQNICEFFGRQLAFRKIDDRIFQIGICRNEDVFAE